MCHFAPDLRRDIRVVFGSLARLCTVYPPYHDGQSRMVEFVKVLKDMPRYEVYAFTGVSSAYFNDLCPKMALWLIEASWEGIYTYFEDGISVWSARYRLRNLNSAMAHLTSSNLIDCSSLSALHQLLPDSPEYPGLEEEPIEGPDKPGILIHSAAQWVMRPDECCWNYGRCKKAENEGITELGVWSMERWREWMRLFGFVMADERLIMWEAVCAEGQG